MPSQIRDAPVMASQSAPIAPVWASSPAEEALHECAARGVAVLVEHGCEVAREGVDQVRFVGLVVGVAEVVGE